MELSILIRDYLLRIETAEKKYLRRWGIKGNSAPLLMGLKMSLSISTPESYKARGLSSSHWTVPARDCRPI